MVELLLRAGADPSIATTNDFERAFDVAKNDETRAVLAAWPEEETRRLLAERAVAMKAQLERRLETAAEREQHARDVMRAELVELAKAGDADVVMRRLTEVAQEARGQRRLDDDKARDVLGFESGCVRLVSGLEGFCDRSSALVNSPKSKSGWKRPEFTVDNET